MTRSEVEEELIKLFRTLNNKYTWWGHHAILSLVELTLNETFKHTLVYLLNAFFKVSKDF